MTTETSLTNLPEELLRTILGFLPAHSLLHVARTSKYLHSLANDPLLWRQRCNAEFKYWESDEPYKSLGQLGVWKNIYIFRAKTDREVEASLEEVITKQRCRIEEMQQIVRCGYDAKAILLKNCHAPDTAEDVLARRYWSLEILNAMQRRKGLDIWAQASKDSTEPREPSLEEGLGAFDMFVLDTREGDIGEISARLDQLAKQLRATCPNFTSMTTRQKAIEIARFIRLQNLTGVHSEDEFHILRNRFLGIALFDDEHQALPLISAAIYCCVAQRLGVNAQLCNVPFHVHASVSSESGFSLDGIPLHSEDEKEHMFMDPFHQDEEVAPDKLRSLLVSMGAGHATHDEILTPATVKDVILRTARNIATAVQTGETMDPPRRSPLSSWTTGLPDMDSAFYGALWSMILLDPDRRRNYLHHIAQFFQGGFTVDVDLMETVIFRMFPSAPECRNLLNLIQSIRRNDSTPKQVLRRTENTKNVRYWVGQTFAHLRYSYEGVIIGWDNCCRASESWIRQMDVDRLNGGRNQSFYHVLVADKSNRYVAEENIVIFTHEPSPTMMNLAGQYFKRWDAETGAFISNIRDEYPDD